MRLSFILALTATPALADYSSHDGVALFTESPCTEAVAAIDTSETTLQAIARMGMAWGFLLGFDTANNGLQGDEETTLIRLRKACAENPETPAATLLRSFR